METEALFQEKGGLLIGMTNMFSPVIDDLVVRSYFIVNPYSTPDLP